VRTQHHSNSVGRQLQHALGTISTFYTHCICYTGTTTKLQSVMCATEHTGWLGGQPPTSLALPVANLHQNLSVVISTLNNWQSNFLSSITQINLPQHIKPPTCRKKSKRGHFTLSKSAILYLDLLYFQTIWCKKFYVILPMERSISYGV